MPFPEEYFLEINPPDPWGSTNPKTWMDDTLQTLRTMVAVDSGKVLLRACQSAGRWILVDPSHDCNAHGEAYRIARPGAKALPFDPANPGKDLYPDPNQLYMGRVQFEKQVYLAGSACYKRKDRGKFNRGFQPDEVFFHELIHAHRGSLRLSLNPPDNGNLGGGLKWYGHEEEFLAIVLTNIYISDASNHHGSGLRADWYGGRPLEAALSTSLSFFESSPQVLAILERFKGQEGVFFEALAGVKAGFNPLDAMLHHPREVARLSHSRVAAERERTVPKLSLEPIKEKLPSDAELKNQYKQYLTALAQEALSALTSAEAHLHK
jgi:hypothetical protein